MLRRWSATDYDEALAEEAAHGTRRQSRSCSGDHGTRRPDSSSLSVLLSPTKQSESDFFSKEAPGGRALKSSNITPKRHPKDEEAPVHCSKSSKNGLPEAHLFLLEILPNAGDQKVLCLSSQFPALSFQLQMLGCMWAVLCVSAFVFCLEVPKSTSYVSRAIALNTSHTTHTLFDIVTSKDCPRLEVSWLQCCVRCFGFGCLQFFLLCILRAASVSALMFVFLPQWVAQPLNTSRKKKNTTKTNKRRDANQIRFARCYVEHTNRHGPHEDSDLLWITNWRIQRLSRSQ